MKKNRVELPAVANMRWSEYSVRHINYNSV